MYVQKGTFRPENRLVDHTMEAQKGHVLDIQFWTFIKENSNVWGVCGFRRKKNVNRAIGAVFGHVDGRAKRGTDVRATVEERSDDASWCVGRVPKARAITIHKKVVQWGDARAAGVYAEKAALQGCGALNRPGVWPLLMHF